MLKSEIEQIKINLYSKMNFSNLKKGNVKLKSYFESTLLDNPSFLMKMLNRDEMFEAWRNAFAHMSYKFELEDQKVVLYADDSIAYEKVFSIKELFKSNACALAKALDGNYL